MSGILDIAAGELQAIVFDFDGVIVESVSVKGDAFVELYKAESQEIQDQVLAYHTENGGVSRFDKIRYYETELCGREIDESGVNSLAEKFSDIVEEMVVQAAWVPGALAFIEAFHEQIPFFIASATPQAELERIAKKRNISSYFNGIFGSPKKKDQHLIDIIAVNKFDPSRVVMIGDATTDYNAAQVAGTKFVGRILPNKKSPFPEGTVIMNDLDALPSILKLVA